MDKLPIPFEPLRAYNQFIVYEIGTKKDHPGKLTKIPVCYRTGRKVDAHDPKNWVDAELAIKSAKQLGSKYGVGFVLTENDPFFFVDLDNCVSPDGALSVIAECVLLMFDGAAVEKSISKSGLHIIAKGFALADRIKNSIGLELYFKKRFIALTGFEVTGTADMECQNGLNWLIRKYFVNPQAGDQPKKKISISCADTELGGCLHADENFTDLADEDLIAKLLNSKTKQVSLLDTKASFKDLWERNIEQLAKAFPDVGRLDGYDESRADMALASHLAYWTKNDKARIIRLMWKSALQRSKWLRDDYIKETISKVCSDSNSNYAEIVQPIALPSLLPVAAFDYSFMPIAFKKCIEDISKRMQCPPDFPAIAMFVMTAAILGRKISVRPKKNDSWSLIPNLWGMVIGNSGVKKSPALSEALSIIKSLQSEAFNNYKNEKLANIQESGEQGDPAPRMKRYIVGNTTYEKLGEILTQNPNGVLVEYDEIIGLLKQLEAKGQEVARSFYLSGANGDTSFTFDRIMRGTLHIPAVCLSVIGGIQPGVLSEYIKQALKGGGGADGLLQRFSLIVYPDISFSNVYVDEAPDNASFELLKDILSKLDNLDAKEIGAENDSRSGVPYLHFNDEAQILYAQWTVDFNLRLSSEDDHPAIISHLSKYQKLVPILALINHLVDVGVGPIGKDCLIKAINFCQYLESHARRIYGQGASPHIESAKNLLQRLKSSKLPSEFKARDVSQKGWAGLDTPSSALAAIEVLLDYQHLTSECIKTKGRSTIRYKWHQ